MIEPLVYLSGKSDLNSFVIDYGRENMPWFPRFYLGKQVQIIRHYQGRDARQFLTEIEQKTGQVPDYVFFYGQENLEKRILQLQELLNINLQPEAIIKPSLIDDILHRLNPRHNLNLTSYVYKVNPID